MYTGASWWILGHDQSQKKIKNRLLISGRLLDDTHPVAVTIANVLCLGKASKINEVPLDEEVKELQLQSRKECCIRPEMYFFLHLQNQNIEKQINVAGVSMYFCENSLLIGIEKVVSN